MSKFVDLTGQTINGIYIKSRAGYNSSRNVEWNAVCPYCGKDFIATGSNIRSGGTKSCGCLRAKRNSERTFEDLSGQIFNSFYVESFYGIDKYGKRRWNARCLLCGNIAHPTTTTLKTGKSKTCGCKRMNNMKAARIVDLTDRRFEMLVAKYLIGSSDHGKSLWYCECDCGCYAIASENDLVRGKVTSCGCLRSRHERQIALWLDDHSIEYERQKTFDGCININPLRFDFYISSANTVVEYDGEFHYMKIDGIDNDYEQQQINDKIKDDYCAEHNIRVLRIPYWEKDNIESILNDWFYINDGEEANSSTDDLSA